MTTLLDALETAGRLAGGSFWLPVLAWTLLAGALLLAFRGYGRGPARTQYHLRVALLLALPLAFALMPLVPAGLTTPAPALPPALPATDLPALASAPPAPDLPTPTTVPEVAADMAQEAPAFAGTPWHLLGLLTAFFAGWALVRLAVFFNALRHLRRLHRSLPLLEDADAEALYAEEATALGVRRPVRLLRGDTGQAPGTWGWRHPAIVIPESVIADPAALRLLLRHELVHIQQHDYLTALACQGTAACFPFHPLVRHLLAEVDFYREAACDAAVLHAAPEARPAYARLLLHFASPTPARLMVNLPFAAPTSTLKKRILAMKNLSSMSPRTGFFALLLLVAVLLIPSAFGAFTRAESPASDTQIERTAELYQEMKRLDIQVHYLEQRLAEVSVLTDDLAINDPRVVRYRAVSRMYEEALLQYEHIRLQYETERQFAALVSAN